MAKCTICGKKHSFLDGYDHKGYDVCSDCAKKKGWEKIAEKKGEKLEEKEKTRKHEYLIIPMAYILITLNFLAACVNADSNNLLSLIALFEMIIYAGVLCRKKWAMITAIVCLSLDSLISLITLILGNLASILHLIVNPIVLYIIISERDYFYKNTPKKVSKKRK